ncbi:MAG: hypothetical protein JSS97_03835 [Actinobacteria bacterium]|nr:hypothetical protein [Actinomycetota bacterium]
MDMSRRLTLVALAALCALAFSALGASGASAAENTAFTCVSGGTEFSNADCSSTEGTKSFHHEAIPVNTPTQLTLKTIAGETTTLAATPGLALVELVATGLSCEHCMAENLESATEPKMKVEGSGGTIKYTGVTTPQSAGCEVPGGTIETKPLKFVTTGTKEAVISPVTPPVLAEFEIKAKTGQKCNITGPYTVNGDVNGTANGAILSVNVTQAQETIKLGVAKASLVGKATIEAGNTATEAEPNPVHHPAALT